jgi:hypothetical protein
MTPPPTWLEDLATADTSWIFDATGARLTASALCPNLPQTVEGG